MNYVSLSKLLVFILIWFSWASAFSSDVKVINECVENCIPESNNYFDFCGSKFMIDTFPKEGQYVILNSTTGKCLIKGENFCIASKGLFVTWDKNNNRESFDLNIVKCEFNQLTNMVKLNANR